MFRTLGQVRFTKALNSLEADAALDEIILISAASLRLLGVRVYTRFIDFLAKNSYYFKKAEETKFSKRYELEPVPLKLDFPMRVGTVKGNLCSFRHLVKPYNIYEEVEFKLAKQVKSIKIRPRSYVRKDCDEAIGRLIQGSNERYWQELYSYHKQIEAIDLGISTEKVGFRPQKLLKLED